MAFSNHKTTVTRKERVNMNKGMGKKGILRNEKGLTLVELLAVIVIIGILAAIAVPSVSGLINKTKEEAHRTNAQIIIDAARLKVAAEDMQGGTVNGNTKTLTVTVEQLVQQGYLERIPADPQNKGGFYHSGSTVTAEKDISTGKVTYSIVLQGNKDGGSLETYINEEEENL